MKTITLKKRSASLMAGLLALVLVGGTWAYYHNEGSLENKLRTKAPGGEQLVEEFTPEIEWEVGTEITKKASVENKSEVDLVVRVKMNEVWTLADGTTVAQNSKDDTNFIDGKGQVDPADGSTTGDGSVVTKKTTSTNWVYNSADGYWYYNAILTAGASTDNFLESITLDSATDMGLKGTIKYYTTMATRPGTDVPTGNPATGWATLTGDMPAGTTFSRSVSSVDAAKAGYAGADYSLFLTYETYQATTDAIDEATTTGGWSSTLTPTS